MAKLIWARLPRLIVNIRSGPMHGLQSVASLILISLCCFNVEAFSQHGQRTFAANSIGVVYVLKETNDSYHLKIAFHIRALPDYQVKYFTPFRNIIDSVTYTGNVTYFDQQGSLLSRRQSLKFQIQFWCDNDGGTQYRPEAEIVVTKTDFERSLKPVPEIKNIAGFIIFNRDDSVFDKPDFSISKNVPLTGDYNNDHEPDCFIWTYYDEAENCDNKPLNHLGIKLQVGKNHFSFRCCGP